jgi:hypothetical protein
VARISDVAAKNLFFIVPPLFAFYLSARSGIDVWSRSKMEVPNALATPVTPFANSGERLIAQVVG